MTTLRKIFGLALRGALLGALLAVIAPPTPASAGGECTCYEDSSGASFQCDSLGKLCITGSSYCSVTCES